MKNVFVFWSMVLVCTGCGAHLRERNYNLAEGVISHKVLTTPTATYDRMDVVQDIDGCLDRQSPLGSTVSDDKCGGKGRRLVGVANGDDQNAVGQGNAQMGSIVPWAGTGPGLGQIVPMTPTGPGGAQNTSLKTDPRVLNVIEKNSRDIAELKKNQKKNAQLKKITEKKTMKTTYLLLLSSVVAGTAVVSCMPVFPAGDASAARMGNGCNPHAKPEDRQACLEERALARQQAKQKILAGRGSSTANPSPPVMQNTPMLPPPGMGNAPPSMVGMPAGQSINIGGRNLWSVALIPGCTDDYNHWKVGVLNGSQWNIHVQGRNFSDANPCGGSNFAMLPIVGGRLMPLVPALSQVQAEYMAGFPVACRTPGMGKLPQCKLTYLEVLAFHPVDGGFEGVYRLIPPMLFDGAQQFAPHRGQRVMYPIRNTSFASASSERTPFVVDVYPVVDGVEQAERAL